MTTFAVPQLQAFKIISCGEVSNVFTQLLKIVAIVSTERLTDVETASSGALLLLANPGYRSFFSHLRCFKVDIRGMRGSVDTVPYFENPEVFEAYGLQLPIYDHDVDLPIVHTLKRIHLKSAPIR